MRTRRHWLVSVGSVLLAAPLAAVVPQPNRVWRVGFLALLPRPEPPESSYYDEFTRGMRELGYVEGKNLVIEWRYADGKYDRLPELAAELVRLKVDVIVAADGTPAPLAAQKATATIPIVFLGVGDPVGVGLVKSLARPQGNSTGISNLASDLDVKQMEMLLRVVPGVSRLGVLSDPNNPGTVLTVKKLQAAAKQIGVHVLLAEARTQQEIETAFDLLGKEHAEALVVVREAFFFLQRRQIATLAAKYRLPCVGGGRDFAEAGILMSYGQSRANFYYRVATYVDKILKGAKPGDLPVEQPTKLELVINRRTASALGLTIPPEILVQADRIIE